MTYKMVAIDLDGTLLSPLGHVTARTKSAVHQCLRAGMLVCFATGRNWTESRTVLEAIEHYASAVFAGGSMVIDTEKRVTLHRIRWNRNWHATFAASWKETVMPCWRCRIRTLRELTTW